jgi:cytochrome c-type biogenesis protein CcmH/NrfF
VAQNPNRIPIALLSASPLAWAAFAARAQEHINNLTDAEQLQLQSELSWINILLWGLVAGLLVLGFCIRIVARRTTQPCHWCAEFIPKKETVCPRCGRAEPFVVTPHGNKRF